MIYYAYQCVVVPYIVYLKYKHHPRVQVADKFIPIIGNAKMKQDDVNNGSVSYHTYRKYCGTVKHKDIILYFDYFYPIFRLRSPQAIQDFEKLVPGKIDREPEWLGYGKFNTGGFEFIRSSSNA